MPSWLVAEPRGQQPSRPGAVRIGLGAGLLFWLISAGATLAFALVPNVALALVAAACLLLATVTLATCVTFESRRTGVGWWRSLGRGLRTAVETLLSLP